MNHKISVAKKHFQPTTNFPENSEIFQNYPQMSEPIKFMETCLDSDDNDFEDDQMIHDQRLSTGNDNFDINGSFFPNFQELGIYGWRKKILYILLAINIVFVIINLALVFWIISVVGIFSSGIGGIDLSTPEQIKFNGSVFLSKLLFAKEIHSYNGQNLTFKSKNSNITFHSGDEETKVTLTQNKIIIITDKFQVYNRKMQPIFALDSLEHPNKKKKIKNDSTLNDSFDQINQLTFHVNGIKLNGMNLNLKLKCLIIYFLDINSLNLPISIQTTLIDNAISEELRLFSPNSHLLLRGPKSIHIESKLGDVSIITFDDLKLKSNGGKIILDTASIQFNLKEEFNLLTNKTLTLMTLNELTKPKVYQVCVCSNTGKIFFAKADSICSIRSYRDCL